MVAVSPTLDSERGIDFGNTFTKTHPLYGRFHQAYLSGHPVLSGSRINFPVLCIGKHLVDDDRLYCRLIASGSIDVQTSKKKNDYIHNS